MVTSSAPSNTWQELPIGVGGMITGIDIAPDNTLVVRTGTYGAYLWNGTQWEQLLSSAGMPANVVIPNSGMGVDEIQIAPSNSNILYMSYDGYVLQSTKKGTTWTETAFAHAPSAAVAETGLSDNGTASARIVATGDTAALPLSSLNVAPPVTVTDGATAEIAGAGTQAVTFAGATGTLILDDAQAFTGEISGLTGSDALDLKDLSYGAHTTVTFLGNASGGTLTITNGTQTANIELVGDYLSSYWTVSSDGNGGTLVVDPASSSTWQPVNVGAGGCLTGMDVAPDGTMVMRTDTYGAYIWNGSQWQQLITSSSMPAAFVAPNLDNTGVYEIQIAPSNSNILYMSFDGYIFQSTNKGATWTETSFAQVTENPNDAYLGGVRKWPSTPKTPAWSMSGHRRTDCSLRRMAEPRGKASALCQSV